MIQPTNELIWKHIEVLQSQNQISHEEMANHLGLTESRFLKMKKQRKLISIHSVLSLSQNLNINFEDLFEPIEFTQIFKTKSTSELNRPKSNELVNH